jgi:hypothetical protein
MATNIDTLLKESLANAENKFKEDAVTLEFEKTTNEFKELVAKGFAQERGYNLLSVSDKQSYSKISFNTKTPLARKYFPCISTIR